MEGLISWFPHKNVRFRVFAPFAFSRQKHFAFSLPSRFRGKISEFRVFALFLIGRYAVAPWTYQRGKRYWRKFRNPPYELQDEFSVAHATPLPSPQIAAPGPGSWLLTDL